jgi:LSD1 subclass zinc finger protein
MNDFSEPTRSISNELACGGCGALLKFKPGTHHLVCEYCGASNEIAKPESTGELKEISLDDFLEKNFEDEDKGKDGGVFSVYAKPEFRFNEFGGAYLGVRYDMFSESEVDGAGQDDDGYLVTLLPGWNATWLPNLATEVNVPVTVMGKSQASFWGINLNVYYTLPL